MTQKNCEGEEMPFLRFNTEQDFPVLTKNTLLELQQLIGPFEYRAVQDRWCIRTIPEVDTEQPLAVLGKTMEAAAQRMMAVIRLMD